MNGYISGALKAEPTQLIMGEAYTGETCVGRVLLEGAQGLSERQLRAESTSPFLKCVLAGRQIDGLGAVAGDTRVSLVVTLGKDAPAGILESNINVTGLDGRRLVIPVTAYIHPKGVLRPSVASKMGGH